MIEGHKNFHAPQFTDALQMRCMFGEAGQGNSGVLLGGAGGRHVDTGLVDGQLEQFDERTDGCGHTDTIHARVRSSQEPETCRTLSYTNPYPHAPWLMCGKYAGSNANFDRHKAALPASKRCEATKNELRMPTPVTVVAV
jgi:hypothetical protein